MGPRCLPWHRLATGRLRTALKAHFRPVIQARGPRLKHQHQQRQRQRSHISFQAVQGPGHIVTVQEIELATIHVWRVPTLRLRPDLKQGLRLEGAQRVHRIAITTTQARARDPAEAAPTQAVIHHPIEMLPLQPRPGIPPDLTHDPGLWIHRLHHAPKLPPKFSWHLIRHVQTSTVDSPFQPILPNS